MTSTNTTAAIINNNYNTSTEARQAAWDAGYRCKTASDIDLMTHKVTGSNIRFIRSGTNGQSVTIAAA